ncbi:DUF397 domain-containing protein [Nocardiopsis sp. CNR-923]|uniref:DUF397 domain-containing protein n=1 Tax=Nocardiopsis sp. CNR-923 TaxID=1904965 RepID=UPI0009668B46|nr:DUF397 domain-containing protein [Nocardiopsis sp. CNR-923]OLT27418.1 DUF397 domain-containing protein [Nocardiopsis sp. CNR-923]
MNRDTSAVVGWRTSSYSRNSGGNCVEVGWHISSYSVNGGGECVEAGPFRNEPGRFAVRDSTQRDLGFLSFPRDAWATFLRATAQG